MGSILKINFLRDAFRKKNILPTLFPLFLWCFLIYFPLFRKNFWINPDIAETLYTASKMLEGKKLYVDWLNVNTPAIYQICEMAEILAKVSHLPSVIFYYSLFFIISFVGYYLFTADRKILE